MAAGGASWDHISDELFWDELDVIAMKDNINKKQQKGFGHISRTHEDREPRNLYEAKPARKKSERPLRMQWSDHITKLGVKKGIEVKDMKTFARDYDA